jgi:hypothetical protein
MTPRLLLSSIACLMALAACQDMDADRTRREVYKLAYRTGQLQEALERCEAPDEVADNHVETWNDNFAAAAEWLGITPETIAERQQAGRDALGEDTRLGCDQVLAAVDVSLATAQRWASRINSGSYCTALGCD